MIAHLLTDRRGAGMVQTIIVASAVALAGVAGYKALGSATSEQADCAGERIVSLGQVKCNNGGEDKSESSVAEPPPPPPKSEPPPPSPEDREADALEELKKLALDILGVTDAVKCFTEGDILACAMTVISFSPWKIIGVGVKLAKNAKRIAEVLDRLADARKARKAEKQGEEVAGAGKKNCKGDKCEEPNVCFAPGTLVHTERGTVPIEELAPGDLVLSRNEQTGEEDYRPIERTFVTPDQPLLALSLEDSFGTLETFEVTAPHPFYVEGQGWVAAGDLVPGDEVVSSGGGRLRVASNQESARRTTVYNFKVEEFATYFVGEGAAWVHNQNKEGKCGKPSVPVRRPNDRHRASSVNQKTVAKEKNTVYDKSVDVEADVKAINEGKGVVGRNEFGEETVTVNGRTYAVESNGTLSPRSGAGFHDLTRAEFKALGVFNKFGNSERAREILGKMGIDAATAQKALEVWQKLQ
jgi:Pretoxin HINT domain